jgi:hypothetical protein
MVRCLTCKSYHRLSPFLWDRAPQQRAAAAAAEAKLAEKALSPRACPPPPAPSHGARATSCPSPPSCLRLSPLLRLFVGARVRALLRGYGEGLGRGLLVRVCGARGARLPHPAHAAAPTGKYDTAFPDIGRPKKSKTPTGEDAKTAVPPVRARAGDTPAGAGAGAGRGVTSPSPSPSPGTKLPAL